MFKASEKGYAHLCKDKASAYDHDLVAGELERERVRAVRAGLDYVFSIVIPIYNTEEFLEECIQSVVQQSIGFGDIQLILVDDGSKDGSAAICERWAQEFPKNIVFVQQKNAGVSAARNTGIAQVRGLWLNFMDSDDMWTEDAFAQILAFHAIHPEVRIIAQRHWFFGARSGPHMLDYKFTTDSVIDIFKCVDYPQLSFNNLFLESGLLQNKRFDTRLQIAEDFALANEIILELGSYGVCSRGVYLYRKRKGGDSAVDSSRQTLSYFSETPDSCLVKLFNLSRELYGEVIPYAQWSVMYDLQWRLRTIPSPFLTEEQLEHYKRTIISLLSNIEDEIIGAQRSLYLSDIIYALSLKYDVDERDIISRIFYANNRFWWRREDAQNVALTTLEHARSSLIIEFITVDAERIVLEGYSDFLNEHAFPSLHIEFSTNGIWREVEYVDRPRKYRTHALDETSPTNIGFRIELGWDGKKANIEAHFRLSGANIPAEFAFGKFVGLNETLSNTYWSKDGYFIHAIDGHKDPLGNLTKRALVISKDSALKREVFEQGLRLELVETREWGTHFAAWRAIGCEARRRRELSPTSVWLISDRPMKAGDNGEALYRWLLKNPQPGVEPVFALSKKSGDWERICSYGGRVVPFASFEYKRLFFRANLIISAAADEFVINGLAQRRPYVKDLYGFKFAFLQHGVIMNDLSSWLNRYEKDIRFFATSVDGERNSIINGDYGYTSEVVRKTGLTRHDALVAQSKKTKPERVIWLMPTWRQELAFGVADPNTGMRPQNPSFESTDYYRFWQGLIANERLNKTLQADGWRMRLVMHPAFVQESEKFHPGPAAEVHERCDYRNAFCSGSVLVSDYSSVTLDFALLRKPVVYGQFDKDEFFKVHAWEKGYFDYERDGFGPVCTTLEETVDAIVELVEGDCKMPQKYIERVEAFYGEQPANRCEEVTKALLALCDRSKDA